MGFHCSCIGVTFLLLREVYLAIEEPVSCPKNWPLMEFSEAYIAVHVLGLKIRYGFMGGGVGSFQSLLTPKMCLNVLKIRTS